MNGDWVDYQYGSLYAEERRYTNGTLYMRWSLNGKWIISNTPSSGTTYASSELGAPTGRGTETLEC